MVHFHHGPIMSQHGKQRVDSSRAPVCIMEQALQGLHAKQNDAVDGVLLSLFIKGVKDGEQGSCCLNGMFAITLGFHVLSRLRHWLRTVKPPAMQAERVCQLIR